MPSPDHSAANLVTILSFAAWVTAPSLPEKEGIKSRLLWRKPITAIGLRKRKSIPGNSLSNPTKVRRYAVMAQLNGYYSAQIAAVKDYMCLPEIEGINIKKGKAGAGDVILIKPKIYLKIVHMDITLYNTDSTVLESGPAVKTGLNWKYNTTTPVEQLKGTRLEVVTYDRFNKACTFVQVLS